MTACEPIRTSFSLYKLSLQIEEIKLNLEENEMKQGDQKTPFKIVVKKF